MWQKFTGIVSVNTYIYIIYYIYDCAHPLSVCLSFTSLHFTSLLQFIKKRIESLIEREYLQRDKQDRRCYNYLAWMISCLLCFYISKPIHDLFWLYCNSSWRHTCDELIIVVISVSLLPYFSSFCVTMHYFK